MPISTKATPPRPRPTPPRRGNAATQRPTGAVQRPRGAGSGIPGVKVGVSHIPYGTRPASRDAGTDATPSPAETVRQKRLIRMCRAPLNRAAMPELAFLHSVPNSTKTSKAIAGRMKAEGVERGAFDLIWDLRRGGWSGLRIEMKNGKEQGRASMEQKAFAAHYAREGFLAVRANDEHEAWDIICWYYTLPKPLAKAAASPLPARLAHAAFPTVHVSRPQKPRGATLVPKTQSATKRPTAPRGAK